MQAESGTLITPPDMGGRSLWWSCPRALVWKRLRRRTGLRRRIELLYKDVNLPERQTAASFGVADFPVCAEESSGLIAAADGALLFAKRHGRNRVAYSKELRQAELADTA